MKKLSELSGDTLLKVDREYYGKALMTKDELVSQIMDGDAAKEVLYVHLLIESPAFLQMGDLQDWMEGLEEQYDQYADWYVDMMLDLNQSKEAKAFIETVNRLARKHMTYDEGEWVDIWD